MGHRPSCVPVVLRYTIRYTICDGKYSMHVAQACLKPSSLLLDAACTSHALERARALTGSLHCTRTSLRPGYMPGNLVEENAPGVGVWGGNCICPDGGSYLVGDMLDSCISLACIGGWTGGNLGCNRWVGAWAGRKVTCATTMGQLPAGAAPAESAAAPAGSAASATPPSPPPPPPPSPSPRAQSPSRAV
eukprot:1940434-Prymnesium_polylepis.1